MESQEEQILQDLLRQKLNGSPEISPLPAGELMDRFLAELMILNDEVTNQREGPCLFLCFTVFEMIDKEDYSETIFVQTKPRLITGAASWPTGVVNCQMPAPIRVVQPSIPTCPVKDPICHVT